MPRLHIKGVVKIMNVVREQLSAGIPASEVDDFRNMVTGAVAQVEQICWKNRSSPERLPAPTFRAYQFLKTLDLDELPVRSRADPPPKKQIRITNLISNSNAVHTELARLAQQAGRGAKSRRSFREGELGNVLTRIQSTVATVEGIFRDEAASPADLPSRSRRAFQWLKFLSEPETLQLHLATLRTALRASRQATCRKEIPAAKRKLPVRVELYNTPALFRARVQAGAIRIVANEGFLGAPGQVIKALVCAALLGKAGRHLSKVKEYANTEEFAEVILALELSDATAETTTRGQHYDLEKVFARVNAGYFGGSLPRPRLTWNATLTHRKLGHYQLMTDTVMISITLDDRRIPGYVIDFVMYHELLHKKLGVQIVNGRHYAHTKTFRAEERKFRRYAEAQAFLRKSGEKLAA